MPPLPLHGYNHSQAWPHWTVSFQVTLRALELDMLEKRDLVVAFLLGAFAFGLGFLWPISAFSKQVDAVSQGTLIAHDQVTGIRSELPRLKIGRAHV